MLGFIIGLVFGAVQFLMLSKFTKTVTTGSLNTKTVLFGVIQFFIPLIVLPGCALLLKGGLLWAGIGMAASLLGCAVVKFLMNFRES